jgi:hypothetical protein
LTTPADQDCLWPRAVVALRVANSDPAALLERLTRDLATLAGPVGDDRLAWLDITHCQASRGSPLKIATRLAGRMARESGTTAWGIGVAASPVVSCYAAVATPNAGIHAIAPWDTLARLGNVAIGDLLPDQPDLLNFLAKRGVLTCAELAGCRPDWLRRYPRARQLWLACAGADHDATAHAGAASPTERMVLPPRTSHTPTLRRYLYRVCRRVLAGLGKRSDIGGVLEIRLELAGPHHGLRTSLDLSAGPLAVVLPSGVDRLLDQRPSDQEVTGISVSARTDPTRGLQLSLFT